MDQFKTNSQITWCPGCGNFGLFQALKNAFLELGLKPDDVLAIYGIGCHGHMVNYLKTFGFQGVHGRALPLAAGAKLANRNLKVIAMVGDGDQLGEGGNHLIHAAKRNIDIKCFIHDNHLYSLTIGQASPTSDIGMKTMSTPKGVFEEPLNPVLLSIAIASGASFVARGFAGNIPHLTKIFAEAISHKGFSLVDILQPCVTLNSLNTFEWYRNRVYILDNHDVQNKEQAFARAQEWGEKIPIGIFYKKEKPVFEDNLPQLKEGILAEKPFDINIKGLLREFA